MTHITQYRYEIRRNGQHFLPVAFDPYFVGNRLHWRVTYRCAASGEILIREYVTNRIMKNGELVIEGTRDA